ncbi:hypothetical protein [Paucibacter sp. M5-1]|uniref:hypothetical protein n=1 Tax=Paucibacter sp. M5-1 TaxID=3015998 RepID=UPI0010F46969|nr:hypothetical protein [Paucibacter sp. M5-1]MCZ7883079.1 hypothetical protein [Paucibacter sp. M5-1]
MSANLQEFTIGIESGLVTPTSRNYRPPSWPPPRDWPTVIDKDGVVVSRWGDPRWDLAPWAGKPGGLNFGDGVAGRAERLDAENADLMRMVATWLIWGPRAAGSVWTVLESFSNVRQIVALCSRNGISAARLMRFPNVLEQVPEEIASSKYEKTISLLHRLYDARDTLGFTLVDEAGLRRLAAAAHDHDVVQTPYIPPRIWLYQVQRLDECVKDFLAHRDKVERCFRFCLEAYESNFGSLEDALRPGKDASKAPFNAASERRTDCTYHGKFSDVAAHFGIAGLLGKWIAWDEDGLQVRVLSAYLSVVTYAALAYIANFTLQRKEEVASLRASCLLWEVDEKLGRVPIICGETTKTDPDSDARWVASPSVESAVQAVSAIARLRMLCDRANPLIRPSSADHDDPYLWSSATEPWGLALGLAQSYEIRQPLLDLAKGMARYPLLFDTEQMRISGQDLAIARRLTPNLPEDEFSIGKIWPLAWHQYRRTGAVNMFASGDISDSTMQQLMKHSSRLMPLYYGRNHTQLHLNDEVRSSVMMAMYEAQAEMVKLAAGDDRFVSPHSQERKDALLVRVMSVKDMKSLVSLAKTGKVSFREHRLGACMKAGACEYGGIESIARCAGGDGEKPCREVLYDREKKPQVLADMRRFTEEINRLPPDSPRYKALVAERSSMENYLNAI